MPRYENFWIVTILRGVFAILIGSAIFVVPDMARTILFLPFAIAVVIISLVAYGIADSVLVFITSFFLALHPARIALRLQSAAGIVIGILFGSILFDRIRLEWFLYLIALQAFATAYAEITVARYTSEQLGSRVSYVAAAVCPALRHDLRDGRISRPRPSDAAGDRFSRLCVPGRLRSRPVANGRAHAPFGHRAARAKYERTQAM